MKPRDCDVKESVLVVEAVEGVVALHVSRGCGKRGAAGVLVDFPWADNWELSCGYNITFTMEGLMENYHSAVAKGLALHNRLRQINLYSSGCIK